MGLLNRFGSRASVTDEERERQERSWAELEAGRLPLSAQERLAAENADHSFSAELSPSELVAVRAAGYEPVGQAFGTSTVSVNRTQARLQSPAPFGSGSNGGFRTVDGSRTGFMSPYQGRPWPIRGYYDSELKSRQRALRRMQDECRALGGEGVIGVRAIRSGIGAQMYEYTVVGTAVLAHGVKVEGTPFLAALSGADFAALARSGWLPVTLVMSMVRWACWGGGMTNGTGRWSPTQELGWLAQLQTQARHAVRGELERQVRAAKATDMLLHEFSDHWEREEERHELEIEAIGTAIVRAGPASTLPKNRPPFAVRPVIRLDGGKSIDL